MVGICLDLHSERPNHSPDISTISATYRPLCHSRQNSDASYSSGKPETVIISFSLIVEDQKEFVCLELLIPDLQLATAALLLLICKSTAVVTQFTAIACSLQLWR